MSTFRHPSLWLLLLAGALAAVFVSPLLVIAIIFAFLAIFFLVRNLEFGLIILVFFFPYLGLVIDFSTFEAVRDVPYLPNINAPFIDLFAVLFFIAWILNNLQTYKLKNLKLVKEFPHLKSYFLFWLSGLISLTSVPSINFGVSFKYLIRPIAFFYLVFFAPVVSILKTHGEKLLYRVVSVFYFTGLISAFDGFLGLVAGAHTDFPRAQPFGFFGINPLGPNHNLLAETLIATAPAGLILSSPTTVHSSQYCRWIRWGMFFQWAIALLTFARTAWIAVLLQALLYFYFEHRGQLKAVLKRLIPVLVIVAILGTLLLSTIFTETVRGSTLSRLDQIRIATFYFVRSPLIGQGVGTFIPTLWQTRAFLLEYGDPLEAHGVIWKLLFEQGILGVLTFGLFVGLILREILRKYRQAKKEGSAAQAALMAALLISVGSVAYQLFNTDYYNSKLWVPLGLALGIVKVMSLRKTEEYVQTN